MGIFLSYINREVLSNLFILFKRLELSYVRETARKICTTERQWKFIHTSNFKHFSRTFLGTIMSSSRPFQIALETNPNTLDSNWKDVWKNVQMAPVSGAFYVSKGMLIKRTSLFWLLVESCCKQAGVCVFLLIVINYSNSVKIEYTTV